MKEHLNTSATLIYAYRYTQYSCKPTKVKWSRDQVPLYKNFLDISNYMITNYYENKYNWNVDIPRLH